MNTCPFVRPSVCPPVVHAQLQVLKIHQKLQEQEEASKRQSEFSNAVTSVATVNVHVRE